MSDKWWFSLPSAHWAPLMRDKKWKFCDFFCVSLCRFKNKHYLCTAIEKNNCKQGGAIAQLVEQRTENPCVPGSIPGGTTCKNSQNVLKQRFGSFSFALKPKFGNIWPTFWYFLPRLRPFSLVFFTKKDGFLFKTGYLRFFFWLETLFWQQLGNNLATFWYFYPR